MVGTTLPNWLRLVGGILVAAVIGCVLLAVPVSRQIAYVDEYTGSSTGYKLWFGCLRTNEYSRTSALDRLMRKRWPDQLKHYWSKSCDEGINIYGKAIEFEDGGHGGAIFLTGSRLDAWMASHPEKDALGLFNLLVAGPPEATQKKVWGMMHS